MANPAIVVDFVANTRDLQAGMRSATGATSGFGSRMRGMGKAALAAAGAAGIGALVATIKTGIDEFTEAQKVGAQTNAVLKSTGKAAGVSSKQVEQLAGSLMKKSGVDDEAIQSGENLLLTFTNIRNEAGKGNDIFNQATKAALDMSVAMGTDMKSSAMQLGKALNDPVKGMTKLQRVGVTFTDAQKNQVAALEKSGKTAEAQKIILQELQKEFGGSAEAAGKTLPGQLSILKQEFSNLAGELVGAVVPAFTTFMSVGVSIIDVLSRYKGVLPAVVIGVTALAAAFVAVKVATALYEAAQIAAAAASAAWAAAQWLLNAALAANPIGIVIVAIAALVAAFIVAYKTSDTFRKIVDDAFSAVLAVAKTLWNWLKSNWPLLLGILTGPIGIAVALLATHWNSIRNAVTDAFSAVRNAIGDAIGWIKTNLAALGTWISGFASGALSTALNKARDVFDKISDGADAALHAVRTAMGAIVSAIEGILGRVKSAAESVANAIKAPINAVIRGWNSLEFKIPEVKIPKLKIGKKTFGGGGFGGATIGFPNITPLAQGGVIDSPTLALVGEAGREIVAPEKLLRDIVGERSVQVRVFIGQTELTDLVRTEIIDANTGLARTLLAGGAG